MRNKINIEENEFISLAMQEQCSACLGERSDAVSPDYLRYVVSAREFMNENTYPTWRTNKDKTRYIGAYERSPTEAFPITYQELALHPELFSEINFDSKKNYFNSNNIITFHCTSCGVRVVKDGNHRLLQCAVQNSYPEVTLYEAVSHDWRLCKVDMKNFCKCISNNQINQDAPKSGAPVS